MKILAVDDEALQLAKLTEAISEVVPDAEIFSTRRPSRALYYAEEKDFDVIFLDIQMRGMTGVELAKLIKRVKPRVNIVFVTAYDNFKSEAMDIRASGYITKPVNAEKIQRELVDLRYPISGSQSKENEEVKAPAEKDVAFGAPLQVQCFGNFDVFDRDHNPIKFKRSKAKEMLAYLIFKRGTRCTSREIAAVLFENMEYSSRVQDSFRHIASAMMKALREVGAEEAVLRDHQNYAINMSMVDCDYYRYIQDDPLVQNMYTGEFMSQYSWAEYIHAYLESKI